MPRLLLLLVVLASCKEVNPDFCKNPANASDPHCKVDAAGMKCTSRDMCSDPATPVCDLMDNGGTCVACTTTDPGTCSGTTPICSSAHSCEACTTDMQCSGVCLPGGDCAAQGNIIWVATNGDTGDGLSATAPCSLQRGLAIASASTTRTVLKLAPGTYPSTGGAGIDIMATAATVTIDGRDGVDFSGGNGPVFSLHNGTEVTFLGGRIHGAQNNDGIKAGMGSTLAVHGTELDHNQDNAIDCDQCTLAVTAANVHENGDSSHVAIVTNAGSDLTVVRSTFQGNPGGGLAVVSRFVIVNNFFFNNGNAGSPVGGIAIATVGATGNRLDFNSLVLNASQAGIPPGVGCTAGSGFVAHNNIVWKNVSAGSSTVQQVAGGCLHAYSDIGPTAITGQLTDGGNNIADDPQVANEASDLHLKPTSPARDKADPATALTGIMATDVDGDARPLPSGQQADIGADEVP